MVIDLLEVVHVDHDGEEIGFGCACCGDEWVEVFFENAAIA